MAEEVISTPTDNAVLVEPVSSAQELRQVRHLEIKAIALLLAFLILLGGATAYVLYARGAFEPTHTYLLLTDDAEGVSIGMDVTFAGFPIGRVAKTDLAENGQVRIYFEVPIQDAKWMRTSSIATLEKGIVGGAKLKIFSNDMTAEPLKPGASVPLLRGDITAELPKVVTQVTMVLDNLTQLTQVGGALAQTLDHVQGIAGTMHSDQGLIGGIMGNEQDAKKLVDTIDSANALLKRLNHITGKADQQVFGKDGVMPGVQQSVREINAMLIEARESLKKVDQVLLDATVISGNAKEASGDLSGLRNEVEASLRKVDRLITDLNRKWPFSPTQPEVKLP